MMNADLQLAYKTFKSDPTSRSQFSSLAKALGENANFADLLRASRLFETSGKDQRLALYYQRWALFGRRRFEEALEVAEAMTQGDEAQPNDFSWVVKILTRLGRNDEAIKVAQGALATWPDHDGLTANLAAASQPAPAADPRVAQTAQIKPAPGARPRPDKKTTGKRGKARR